MRLPAQRRVLRFVPLAPAYVLATSLAAAQPRGFALDRFDPSERGSEWFVLDSLDLRGHKRVALGVVGAWTYKPLVAYGADGNEVAALVEHQVVLHPGATLVLADRLRLGTSLPIVAYQTGEAVMSRGLTYLPPGTTSSGDLRLSADVRIVGRHREPFTVATGMAVHLPTGARDDYTSDGYVRPIPRVAVAGDISRFTYAARAGFAYRALDDRFDGNPLGSEVLLGGAAGLRLVKDRLVVGPEVQASSIVADDAFLKKRGTPIEWIFSAHYTYRELRLGMGIGRGLTRGWGTPAFRAFLSVEWIAPFLEQAARPIVAPPPPPPETPAPLPVPVPVPVPAPDRDADGITDDKDACPDEAGPASTDPLANGCPADRDSDGIVDETDACPDAPGPADPDARRNGCPLARIEQGQIKILDGIRFGVNSAVVLRDSEPTLLAVAALLKQHREIVKLRIEGHSDDRGEMNHNRELSFRRAAAVEKWFVGAGLDKKRFEAKGFGPVRPIAPNQTDSGREANRRVEFHIEVLKQP
jgi:OmpA-OmpF porin, OOP family